MTARLVLACCIAAFVDDEAFCLTDTLIIRTKECKDDT